jgi:hypothetical protein
VTTLFDGVNESNRKNKIAPPIADDEIKADNIYSNFREKQKITLINIKVGEKWGFINHKGDVVIKPSFNEAFEFKDNGLVHFNNTPEDKVIYLNKSGSFTTVSTDSYGIKHVKHGNNVVYPINYTSLLAAAKEKQDQDKTKQEQERKNNPSIDIGGMFLGYLGSVAKATGEMYGNAIRNAGNQASNNGFSYTTCSKIKDYSLREYCKTDDCNNLHSFKNGRYHSLCSFKQSFAMPSGEKLPYAMEQYLNYGSFDAYKFEHDLRMKRDEYNVFDRHRDSPSERTKLVIFWINDIHFK